MNSNTTTKDLLFNQKWTCRFVLSLGLILVFLAIGNLKKGYHLDELHTFLLSNHKYSDTNSIHLKINDGIPYSGKELWEEYLIINESNRFNYPNVWVNQNHDVHPPLYYVLFHTASSLFPNMSNNGIGLLINIPLALIVFWQLEWIFERLIHKKTTALILTLTYILSYGFLDCCIVFFRMYTLLAVWMNFLIIVFLKYPPEDTGKKSYYISLGITLLGGILTQYYFLIYAFFACLTYAVYVILSKNRRKLIFSIITAGVSGIIAIVVYPTIIYHIFGSNRGKEAFSKVTAGNYFNDLWKNLGYINSNIFGGIVVVLFSVLIYLAVILTVKKKDTIRLYPYTLLIIPVCLYIIVVSKIAPYRTFRYFISNTGILYIGVFALFINMANQFSKIAYKLIISLAVVMLFSGYRQDFTHLYPEIESTISTLQQHSSLPCFYLYDANWKILRNMQELRYLDCIIFININMWEDEKSAITQNTPVIVYIDENYPNMLDSISEHTHLTNIEPLFSAAHSTAYLLK